MVVDIIDAPTPRHNTNDIYVCMYTAIPFVIPLYAAISQRLDCTIQKYTAHTHTHTPCFFLQHTNVFPHTTAGVAHVNNVQTMTKLNK